MDRRNFLRGFCATVTIAAVCPVDTFQSALSQPVVAKVSFDEIVALTLKAYRHILIENLMPKNNVVYWNLRDGRIPTRLLKHCLKPQGENWI